MQTACYMVVMSCVPKVCLQITEYFRASTIWIVKGSVNEIVIFTVDQGPLGFGLEGRPFACCCSSQAKYPRLPIHSRSAIQASDIVVFDRSSCASLSFFESPLRRCLSSASGQPIRLS